jgi:hypothetical protein
MKSNRAADSPIHESRREIFKLGIPAPAGGAIAGTKITTAAAAEDESISIAVNRAVSKEWPSHRKKIERTLLDRWLGRTWGDAGLKPIESPQN